jgi:hypothetical protein
MSARSARRLAWGVFALFIALMLAELWLIAVESRPVEDAFFFLVVGYALAGSLIASRHPRNAVGWLLLTIGLGLAIGAVADTNIRAASAPLFELCAWMSAWTWYVWLFCAGVFLPLVFPTGKLVSRRWRSVLWLGIAATATSVAAVAFKPGTIDTDAARPVENPLGLEGAGGVLGFLSGVGDVMAAAAFVAATASLVVRFRRARGTERQQLKWFAYAGGLAAFGLGLAMLQVLFGLDESDAGTGAEGGWLELVGAVGWFTALGAIVIGIPLATGMAILRHRLYDIDVVIRRTLVYGALTAILVASYLGIVLLLQVALSPLTEDNDLAIAGSTLAAAALFRPARGRIQALVDRRFYRRRYDTAHTIAAFGARLRDQVELDALSVELREVVGDTMQPAHLSLWLRRPA